MNGRGEATPVHASQLSEAGGVSVRFGSGSVSPHFFSLQEWTSFTLPIAPARINFTAALYSLLEWTWMPICVGRFFLRAYSVSRRTSWMLCASGFWQYTGSPLRMAHIAIGACM